MDQRPIRAQQPHRGLPITLRDRGVDLVLHGRDGRVRAAQFSPPVGFFLFDHREDVVELAVTGQGEG